MPAHRAPGPQQGTRLPSGAGRAHGRWRPLVLPPLPPSLCPAAPRHLVRRTGPSPLVLAGPGSIRALTLPGGESLPGAPGPLQGPGPARVGGPSQAPCSLGAPHPSSATLPIPRRAEHIFLRQESLTYREKKVDGRNKVKLIQGLAALSELISTAFLICFSN